MALSISQIVNVQLNTVPKSAARKSFGIVALFTPEAGQAFADATTRYVYVENQRDVEQLFGTNSETAKAAQPFFAQSPRAKQLIIARWQKAPVTIEATKNTLSGATLSDDLDRFKAVVNGQFSLTIGTAIKKVTELSFADASDFNAIATKIQAKLTALSSSLSISYDSVGQRFIITSNNAGEDKATEIHYAFNGGGDGEYIGSLLKLENGQASRKVGKALISLKKETVAEALFNVAEVNNAWYGFTFAAQLTDGKVESAAKYAQANTKMFGANVIRVEQLEWSADNIYKKLYDAGLDHTLAMFDKNDMYPASSALARLLSTNFAANNSTLTLKFKQQPTITADEIVILDWFTDAVQKEVFARLYKSPTKIPLTDKGQAVLIAAVEKVCLEGVNNGAFAPGQWTGDSFGNLTTGDYLEKGYYVWAAPMDTLSDSDREQRRATPIQTAVKLAGAIHSSDVIVNYNR